MTRARYGGATKGRLVSQEARGAGGGRGDGLRGEVALLCRQTDLDAPASIAGVALYLVLQSVGLGAEPASYVGMSAVAALRFAAIRRKLRLPVFRVPNDESTKP